MLPRRLLGPRGLLRMREQLKCCKAARQSSSAAKIVHSSFEDINIPNITVQDKVLQDVGKWSQKTAIECVLTNRGYTFQQLEDLSRRVGAGLLRGGLKPGQVISIVLPNMPEFIIAALGAMRAGLTVSTINPLYGPDEILHQIVDSESALVLTYPQKVGEVQAALQRLKGPAPPIGVIHRPDDDIPEGTRSFLELFASSDYGILDQVKTSPDSVALLLYSSGTTGLPKGVKLTHKNIVANMTQICKDKLLPFEPTTKDHQDVHAAVLPFFHVYGLVIGALSYLCYGVKLATLPKFDKDLYIKALTEKKATIANVVPPIVQFLASHPDVKASHLDSLRSICNGAAALSPTDAQRLLEKKKNLIIGSGYGLTESSPVITAPRNDILDLDAVGYIIPNTKIKIINPDSGEILDPTSHGEVCAYGPQIMAGYHNNKEATDKTLIDGWLHTGDIGYVKDNKLFIVDRLKELIKVKGFQVAPMELEELLRSYPGVVDVGVVGKPDQRSGEVPVAFVVTGDKKPSAQELKDFVASKVTDYKKLSDIIFVDSIPKNLTGKILRRKLRDHFTK